MHTEIYALYVQLIYIRQYTLMNKVIYIKIYIILLYQYAQIYQKVSA